MLTNNFRAIAAALPTNANTSPVTSVGNYHVTTTNGRLYYYVGYPHQNYYPNQLSMNSSSVAFGLGDGISIGTGTTPPTPNDYNLESQITSGFSCSVSSRTQSVDSLGNPILTVVISATNNTGSSVVISEICWKVSLGVAAYTPGGPSNSSSYTLMLDRTLLKEPITIQNGASGLIEYAFKSDLIKPKTISGVEIVPFSYGTDAQIAAMIEAAHDGIIDLQADAGWCIGDVRQINIGAVGTYDAHNNYLIISSFEEYEGCGNIMQLDTAYNYLKAPMNSTNTNVGGYGASTMYTTFLPSVESALPQWLKDLLIEFNVKASAGNQSSEIVTVPNNKLALRSVKEIFNGIGYGYDGEGSQVDLYKRTVYQTINFSGSTANRWARSPSTDKSSFCCQLNSTGSSARNGAASNNYVNFFMCV